MLLRDKRSENTRRAYQNDVAQFFAFAYSAAPSPELLRSFFAQTTPQMTTQILRYKAELITAKRAEATINRRMCALKSLIKLARRVGATQANPIETLDAEKVVAYRDTRGISAEQAKILLRLPDKTTPKGRRDFALLLLLLENALRRAEVCTLTLADFEADGARIWIIGKGRGTQRQAITISRRCIQAITAALADRNEPEPTAPLFANFHRGHTEKRLSESGLFTIIREYAKRAGFDAPLSPHRLRHTAITMALDASGGDIRKVQRLSRHVKMETLQIYDDNRQDLQGEMTKSLSRLLEDEI